MKNIIEFNTGLVAMVAGKKTSDTIAQRLAEFAINQSIEHNNADCGIRLIKIMQESKYGNVKAMVKYLCAMGQFAVDEKTQKMVFKKQTGKVIQGEREENTWLKYGKVEQIEQPKDEAWIIANVAKMLKTAREWAKNHPDKAATNKTLNKLNEFLPQVAAPKAPILGEVVTA